jgi:hypothetical protein
MDEHDGAAAAAVDVYDGDANSRDDKPQRAARCNTCSTAG